MPTFTRAYLTRRAHGVIQPGPCLGDIDDQEWGPRLNGIVAPCHVLSDTKVAGGNLTQISVGEAVDIDGWSIIFRRWKTDKLTAQTISGTINVMGLVSRTDAAATACWKVYAAVTVGDTNTIGAQTMSAVVAEEGDRLLLELMVSFPSNPDAAFETGCTLRIGTTVSGSVVGDLTDLSTSLILAPWVDFSNAITTQAAVAAPANDACADAIVISSLPYDSGAIDATSSADTNKGMWWIEPHRWW
jgi:hypothetical protein